jgi:hypothetical protein
MFVAVSLSGYSEPDDYMQRFRDLLQENHAGNIDVFDTLNGLWNMFLEYPDSEIKAEIIIALGTIGKNNRTLIDNINSYLMEINKLFVIGETVDYSLVSACITALMELGDSSSYPVLFSIINSGYPEVISSEASGALTIIPGNLTQFLLDIINNNPADEKFVAFRVVMNSDRFSIPDRGRLAEAALTQGLLALSDEDDADLAAMSYAAILTLTQLRWTRASTLAIRHFYRVQSDFIANTVSKERFLEAIAALGAVGNSDAALVLGFQLDLINLRMQTTGVFDPEITLEVVQALGLIGDNAVFEKLQTVVNLQYTDDIIAAAKEAIDRLRW